MMTLPNLKRPLFSLVAFLAIFLGSSASADPQGDPSPLLATKDWKLLSSSGRTEAQLGALLDGNPATGVAVTGAARTGGDWLRIDFGKVVEVSAVEILDKGNFTQLATGEVFLSLDGSNWGAPEAVASPDQWVANQTTLRFDLAGRKARFLRIVDVKPVPSWWQISELKVFGTPTAMDVPAKGASDRAPESAGSKFDFPRATGAKVDEGTIRKVVQATPGFPGQPSTLRKAFEEARGALAQGIPVKIRLAPGVYEEDLSDLTWEDGNLQETLLVIEGSGDCVWTGAGSTPFSEGTKEGDLWRFPWRQKFGMYSPYWGPKNPLAHRSEVAFVNDLPLRPVMLERFKVTGMEAKFGGGKVGYEFIETLDPASTLKSGEFGVIEESERGEGTLYLKVPKGVDPKVLSVSLRRSGLSLTRKNNVVLRGIAFTRFANGMRTGSQPVIFSRTGSEKDASRDVLIENCRFLWNGGGGLAVNGKRWTLRGNVFNCNGYSGVSSDGIEDFLCENNETSFNIWRGYLGGEPGWAYSGIKFHETRGHSITGHLSVGNCNNGLWWDIHCKQVFVSNCVMYENLAGGYMMELGVGPYVGDRLFSASSGPHPNTKPSQLLLMNAGEVLIKNSVFWGDRWGLDPRKPNCATVVRASYTRTDPHAKRQPVPKGEWILSNCVVHAGSNQRYVLQSENWNAPADAMTPRGFDNRLFSEKGSDAFRYHLVASDAYPDCDLAEYARVGNEVGVRWEPVPFRDPSKGDFRWVTENASGNPDSALPQVLIPKHKLDELKAFRAWLGIVAITGVNAEGE